MTTKEVGKPQSYGNGSIRRAPTPDELKAHEAERPKVLAGIRKAHGETMRKVQRLYNDNPSPRFIDRG